MLAADWARSASPSTLDLATSYASLTSPQRHGPPTLPITASASRSHEGGAGAVLSSPRRTARGRPWDEARTMLRPMAANGESGPADPGSLRNVAGISCTTAFLVEGRGVIAEEAWRSSPSNNPGSPEPGHWSTCSGHSGLSPASSGLGLGCPGCRLVRGSGSQCLASLD